MLEWVEALIFIPFYTSLCKYGLIYGTMYFDLPVTFYPSQCTGSPNLVCESCIYTINENFVLVYTVRDRIGIFSNQYLFQRHEKNLLSFIMGMIIYS